MQEPFCPSCGGSILDKYAVKLYAHAYRDLEGIYSYIADNLSAPIAADNIINALEEAIYSLEVFPERGAIRKIGIYADSGYRQLFVKKYIIVYRVLKEQKEVHIVTVRYAPSNF